MKKNNILKLFFLLSAEFLFFGKITAAHAAEASFNFTINQQSFPVDQATITSWQGSQILENTNILATEPEPLNISVLKSLGEPTEQSSEKKIYSYKLAPIYSYLDILSKTINRQKVEPVFKIENGKVSDFNLGQNGEAVDVYQTSLNALDALQIGNLTSKIISVQTTPEKKLSELNDLGINELIAEGVSNFKGSPKNRRFNIAVGTEKFKGVIIPKDAEFSFDKILGPVEADSGFLPELVIDNGQTLPEFGGGLCQVSTTTFRAAMQAGLPITARRNHAYAVQYYSPQGTDATIYPGSADLKFINDTPGAILIWPYQKDANTLVFDFYGTKDTRQVTLQTPVISDRKPDGSMKAVWTRLVTLANGRTRTDVFKSTYQPPALFHKTESYVSATGTPASNLQTKPLQ